MSESLNPAGLDLLFREARTFTGWQDRPVSEDQVRQLYELLKWAPTSMNSSPARFAFIQTQEAKERLRPHLSPGNVDKTMSAPLTVIVATDPDFYEQLPLLAPHAKGAKERFAADDASARSTAFRNSTLQGAYLILAARALGLDCGPMSGFNNTTLDAEFFAESGWESNFLCNLGYGEVASLRPRAARLEFETACQIL